MANRKAKTQFFKTVRWLHIYISTALFSLLLFFAITGITLNHGWYHADGGSEQAIEHAVSDRQQAQWFSLKSDGWSPNLELILAFLSNAHGLGRVSSIDIDEANRELYIEYHVPSGGASVYISAEDQLLEIDVEKGSALGVLNDLHKGRHSGVFWFWLIDISAGLMVLFAITGVVLLFHGKKHQRTGLVVTLLGALSPIIFYVLWVPSL